VVAAAAAPAAPPEPQPRLEPERPQSSAPVRGRREREPAAEPPRRGPRAGAATPARRPVALLAAALAAAAIAAVLIARGGGADDPGRRSASTQRTTTTSARAERRTTSSSTSERPTTSAAPEQDEAAPAPAAPAPSTASPEGAVQAFYGRAAAHRYEAAWALAAPSLRAQLHGFAAFRSQFSSVRSIRFGRAETVRRSADAATVAVTTTATHTNRVDRCTGTADAAPAPGGGWVVTHLNISC